MGIAADGIKSAYLWGILGSFGGFRLPVHLAKFFLPGHLIAFKHIEMCIKSGSHQNAKAVAA